MPDEGGVVVGQPGQLTVGGGGAESTESSWRGRALQAEEKIKELEQSLAGLREELEAGKRTLDAIAQRREVERQLIDAKAQDVESALLLVEQTLAKGDEKDVGRVVADVKQRKPHLFEVAKVKEAVAMGAGGAGGTEKYESAVERAFEKARGTGGTRKSLLEYLRAKRG
jgi:predicted  nucleic acid-binding Zn-ribbon protein